MEYGESAENQTMMTYQDYQYGGKEFDRKFEINLYDFHARPYDATRAQWTSPDPLAEKYYSISPYAYCANNPLKFVDPDGRRILVVGTKEYRKQVLNDLKQLQHDNSDIGIMIKDLIKSPNDHIIEMPKNNEGYNYSKSNLEKAEKGIPQGTKIGYDPNKTENRSGDKRTPKVGLAHELNHSFQADKGDIDTKLKTETGVPLYEVDAIKTENKIREKYNDKQRTDYGGKKISKIWLNN